MSDQFLAEIRMFPGTYAPKGWALCNGQTMPINQNTALFSLLGTIYGGDGRSTFGLPNLQGALPVQQGQGAGLSAYSLGQKGGSETVTLTSANMPPHGHSLNASAAPPQTNVPSSTTVLARASTQFYQTSNLNLVGLNAAVLPSSGNNEAHSNLMPYLAINFCIALVGIFPSRP